MSIINIISEEENTIITLNEIKNFLRIDFSDDDDLLKKSLNTATKQCEIAISQTLNKKTYKLSFYNQVNKIVKLNNPPIINITSVKTVDTEGKEIEINQDLYNLDIISGILIFKCQLNNFYRIDIVYSAGYENVPEDLKQGILFHVAKMYEDKCGYSPIPKASFNIYKNYKTIRL